eukprot:188844_1
MEDMHDKQTESICETTQLESLTALTFEWIVLQFKPITYSDRILEPFQRLTTDAHRAINLNDHILNPKTCSYHWHVQNQPAQGSLNTFSPLIQLHSFKWHLEYIRAHNMNFTDYDDDDDDLWSWPPRKRKALQKIAFRLWLSSFSPNISDIVIKYRFYIEEIELEFEAVAELNNHHSYVQWRPYKQWDSLDSFTVMISVTLLNVHERYTGNVMNHNPQTETVVIQNDTIKTDDFTWNIPFVMYWDLVTLCNGFIREMGDDYYVENELIKLCIEFANYDVMSDIKAARVGEAFKSAIFVMHGFKWMMNLYPKGKEEHARHFDVYLHLVTASQDVRRMAIKTQLSIKEMEFSYGSILYIQSYHPYCSIVPDYHQLQMKDFAHITSLHVRITMQMMDVFDHLGNAIVVKKKKTKAKHTARALTQYYLWTIDDNTTHLSPIFVMFGWKWFLSFYPTDAGTELALHLVSLPADIIRIQFEYELSLKESNTVYTNVARFNSYDNPKRTVWPEYTLTKADIMEHKQLSFSVSVQLIDVYNDEDQVITDKLVRKLQSNSATTAIVPNTVRSSDFIWNFKDDMISFVAPSSHVLSPIFELYGLKWHLQLMKDAANSKLSLDLWCLSISPTISRVAVQYYLSLSQADRYTNIATFDHSNPVISCGTIAWDRIKEPYQVTLSIVLIDVNDHTKNITNQFIHHASDAGKAIECASDEFVWRIPFIKRHQIMDLCIGYLGLDPLDCIDGAIVHLIVKYARDDTLQRMRKATADEEFRSNIFTLHGFKWCLEITRSIDDYMSGSLYICSLPPCVDSITAIYHVEIPALHVVYSHFVYFTSYQWENWIIPEDMIKFKQLQKIKSLAVKIRIAIIDSFDTKQSNLCEVSEYAMANISHKPILSQFQWNVDLDNAKPNPDGHILSPLFESCSLTFYMEFYPKRIQSMGILSNVLYLRNISFPKHIQSIDIHCELQLVQTGRVYSEFQTISSDNTSVCLGLSEIPNLASFTFIMNIYLLNAYDKGCNQITDRYRSMLQNSMICCTKPLSFVWTLSHVLHKQKAFRALSPVFCMYSMKWYLQISKEDKPNADIKCNMGLSMPPNISTVTYKYELTHNEVSHEGIASFTEYDHAQTTESICIALKDIDELVLTVSISLIKVIEEETRQNITQQFIENATEYKNTGEDQDGVYLWKIQSQDKQFAIALCQGYISQHCEHFMEHKVVLICCAYVHDDAMQMIKTANRDESIQSNMFIMNGLKWIMKLYPKGSDKERDDDDDDEEEEEEESYVDMTLHLLSLPSNVKRMVAKINVVMDAINTTYSSTKWFETDSTCVALIADKSVQTNVFDDLTQFTTKIEMNIIDIFDKHGHALDINSMPFHKDAIYRCRVPLYDRFEWKIGNSDMISGQNHHENLMFSPRFRLFGFKWFLAVEDPGFDSDFVVLYLHMSAIPPNIAVIQFESHIVLHGMPKKDNAFVGFQKYTKCIGCKYDKSELRNAMQTGDAVTFITNISLIDVYDKENEIITQQYMNENKMKLEYLPQHKGKIWKIEDMDMLVAGAVAYESDVFEISALKWRMEVDSKDSLDVSLHLISMSPFISKVVVYYKLEFVELPHTFDAKSITFDHEERVEYGADIVCKTYKLKDINSLTLKLDIVSLDVFDVDGNDVDQSDSGVNPSPYNTDAFEWRLSEVQSASNGYGMCSPCFVMHGLQWNVILYPNGIDAKSMGKVKMKLKLNELPNRIEGVSCKFVATFNQKSSIKYANYFHFKQDHLSLIATENSELRNAFLKNWTQSIMTVQITLIDVYDENDKIPCNM